MTTFDFFSCTIIGTKKEQDFVKFALFENHNYKIGTWNVKTLNQGGKLENLKKEMQKNEVSVLGVSEVRW